MNNTDITEIIEIIITIASLLITTFLVPLLRKRLSAEKLEELRLWVSIAVSAAEQLYGSKTGQQKKEYVLSFLLDKGIVFDAAEVAALIEAEVNKLQVRAKS